MAVSMNQVRAALDPEEPNYESARSLGPDAVPHLRELVAGDDPMLASKATYLAGLIGDETVVAAAAGHDDPAVRVAAAAAASNLPAEAASDVLLGLVTDDDPGVRKVARSSAPEQQSDALAERLAELPAEPAQTPEPPVVGQLMPGETTTPGTMPGSSTGLMPGESADQMPGDNQGRMPD